jgi:CBS domain-containing protein
MALRARDLMETEVVTVSPDEPVGAIQRLFFEEEIHGAPVVDDEERVIGIVSVTDLLRAATEARDTEFPTPSYLRGLFEASESEWGRFLDDFEVRTEGLVAQDVMTEGAITIDVDAEVPEIARTLREGRIHRLVVTEGGRMRGILTTFDLLALLEKG